MSIAIPAFSPISCPNGMDGTATAMPSGGTPPYTYLWPDGQTTASVTGMAGGTQSVTVTDANGCTSVNGPNLSFVGDVVDENTMVAVNLQDIEATLRWDTLCGALTYQIKYFPSDDPANVTTVYKYSNTGQKQITGLTPGTKYIWTVKPSFAHGWGLPSRKARFTTLAAPCFPPNNLTTEFILKDQIKIQWDAVTGATRYRIRWRPSTGGAWSTASVNSDREFYWITGLATNTQYSFSVKTVCEFGSSAGSTWAGNQSATTLMKAFDFATANEQQQVDVVVFPNPTHGNTTLSLSGIESDQVRIEVVNLMGAVVYQDQIAVTGNDFRYQFNLTGNAAGVYFIRIADANFQHIERLVID